MKESSRYFKAVYWSDEDNLYIGVAPGLIFGGCCHGEDEQAVFAELVEIVEEWIDIIKARGEELPPATIGRVNELLADNPLAAE